MADVEYIVPGSGIVDDTEEGFEAIVPGFGIYQEQEAAAGGLPLLLVVDKMGGSCNTMRGL